MNTYDIMVAAWFYCLGVVVGQLLGLCRERRKIAKLMRNQHERYV